MMNLEQSRELEGNLKAFKFPEVLQFLSLNLMTGVLSLFQEERRAELAFKEGKIVSVFSNERYMRLGTMLVAQGRITQRALDEALESQDATRDKRYLGEILIERGLIDAEELRSAIHLQIEEELWELFSWDYGMFRFEQGLERAPEMATVELDVAPLLQEGARRMEEWRVLCSQIDKPTEVLAVNPDFPPRPDPPLDEKTWRVLSLINGRLNVQALVRFSNLGKFETYWSLDRLLRSELIIRGPSTASRFDGQTTMRIPTVGSFPNIGNETIRTSAMNLAAGVDSSKSSDKKGRKGGLFGIGKNAPAEPAPVADETEPAPVQKTFPTDVALACSAFNRYLNLLMAEQEFAAAAAQDPAWLEQLWRSVENLFPRADILKIDTDGVHCGAYDRLARLEGQVTRPLQGTHDDALEALRLAWNKLREFAALVLAERADSLSEKAARPYVNCTATIRTPEFSFIRWKEEGFGTKAAGIGR